MKSDTASGEAEAETGRKAWRSVFCSGDECDAAPNGDSDDSGRLPVADWPFEK